MDFTSIVRQLFALDPHQAPATLPTNTISSAAPQQLAQLGAKTGSDPSTGKVLADLAARSTPQATAGARGPLGIATGPLPDVKGKNRSAALFTGMAAGMNNAQNAAGRDQTVDAARAKSNLDTMKLLFDQQSKQANLAETKRANDIREKNADALKTYYQGIVQNGRLKAAGGGDVVTNEHQIEMTKRSAAQRLGLNAPQVQKDLLSQIPSIRDPAKAEYDRRKGDYDRWEKAFDARVAKGLDPVNAAVDAHTATGTDGTPATGGAPTPPAARRTPITGKPATPDAPTPAPDGTGATPPVASPQTWKTIKRQMPDGTFQRQLFNPATGETRPLGESGNTPPTPGASFPDPSSVGGSDPAPQPSEDPDSEE